MCPQEDPQVSPVPIAIPIPFLTERELASLDPARARRPLMTARVYLGCEGDTRTAAAVF